MGTGSIKECCEPRQRRITTLTKQLDDAKGEVESQKQMRLNAIRKIEELQPKLKDTVFDLESQIIKLRSALSKYETELRWYGKIIAGGGPMTGYEKAAKKAEARWYDKTLPMLEQAKGGENDT